VTTTLAQYTYDALNNQIEVVEGGETRYTLYDGQTPLLDFNGSGTVTARYLSVPGAIDEMLARQTSTGVAWYLTDREGSVNDIINNSGTVIDHIDYSVYGTVLDESSPSSGDRFKYAGMELDAVIGEYYDRARFYDATMGRFLDEDPLSFLGGDDNLYRYSNNNPSSFVDPTGELFWVPILIGIGVASLILGNPTTASAPGPGDTTIADQGGGMIGDGALMLVGGYVIGKTFCGIRFVFSKTIPYTKIVGLLEQTEMKAVANNGVVVDASIEGTELTITLTHEGIHSLFDRLKALSPQMREDFYSSIIGKIIEEGLAEALATGRAIHGLCYGLGSAATSRNTAFLGPLADLLGQTPESVVRWYLILSVDDQLKNPEPE
jgi:RHS repeat-associated protein